MRLGDYFRRGALVCSPVDIRPVRPDCRGLKEVAFLRAEMWRFIAIVVRSRGGRKERAW